MRTIIILPLLLLVGCEGHYRYPCQDPANWGKIECNNEVCQAEGTCTSLVLARQGTLPSDTPMSDQENYGDDVNGINNSECQPNETEAVVNLYAAKGDRPRNFGVKNPMMLAPQSIDTEPDLQIFEEADSAAGPAEVPLTMNTIVDTAAHNSATR